MRRGHPAAGSSLAVGLRLAAGLLLVSVGIACAPPRRGASPADQVAAAEGSIPATSPKRGVAYHFCGWPFSEGEADLDAMRAGLSWYYNWSSKPLECADGLGVGTSPAIESGSVEFVPMVWGLIEGGEGCAAGGPCFRVDERGGGLRCREICEASNWSFDPDGACYACYHEGISREAFLADVPPTSRYLLGFNEPNFKEQANLSPAQAAAAWRQLEWVAERRDLLLVGPATNYCDPTPGARHAGACIEEVDGRSTVGPAWLESFYDACSEAGIAGRACRIDYQSVHAYSCAGVDSMIDLLKRKAGLSPPTEAHCTNGRADADEFGLDCGGVHCPACTEHARTLFAKPVWLTEFATPKQDCGLEDPLALQRRTAEVLRRQIPRLEADPYVFRYAWFMPKTDIDSLDHADLLMEGEAGVLSPLGQLYFGQGEN
jgi:hypothetical protein